jgi:hypothetical protein
MKTKTTPSVDPTSPATVTPGGFTLGLDLGDRSHHVCVMEATGQIRNDRLLLPFSQQIWWIVHQIVHVKFDLVDTAPQAGTNPDNCIPSGRATNLWFVD